MRKNALALAALVGAGIFSASVSAEFHRGYILIVGSSAVTPYVKAVGERLVKNKRFQTPLAQATGTSGGIKLFCEGLGVESPDIVATARPMKTKERDECRTNGVGDVLELKIGYDGLVLAQSKKAPPLALTRKEARLALAKWVADASGKLVLNPNKSWSDINPAFPATPIEVYGPPPVSGAYDAFADMIADQECKGRPWSVDGKAEPTLDALKKCRALREDGAYVEGRENDEDLAARLGGSPAKVAIFDYGLLTENAAHSRAIPIDGVEPDQYSIANKAYPGTRPLFLYVKQANIGTTPGLKEFIAEAASENAWGDKGYLKSLGLVVMPPEERATQTADVKALGITPVATVASGTGTGKKASAKGSKTSATKEAKPAAAKPAKETKAKAKEHK
ncbi:substrate-binding domain-containing protein [Methylomagnum sp.]